MPAWPALLFAALVIAASPPTAAATPLSPAAPSPATPAQGDLAADQAACAKAGGPVDVLVCADPLLAALDRLVARAEALARTARPSEVAALDEGEKRWRQGRAGLVRDKTDGAPLVRAYQERLRQLITIGGEVTLKAVLAAARPIDPMREAEPAAEEEAAFLAFVLTTRFPPRPLPPPKPGEEELLSVFELYAGFTFAATLPDGRLFVAVPRDCDAIQCETLPFAVDTRAGAAQRLAVEVPDKAGAPVADPAGTRQGAYRAAADGTLEIFEQAALEGGCGTRWVYRAQGNTLVLARRTLKLACDGQPWTEATTTTRSYH